MSLVFFIEAVGRERVALMVDIFPSISLIFASNLFLALADRLFLTSVKSDEPHRRMETIHQIPGKVKTQD